MFHDAARFAFTEALKQHYRLVYDEFLAVRDGLVDWVEKDLYGEGWTVFGLYDFPHGRPIEENCRRCPITAALVRDHLPTHGAAGFSVLGPMTRIRPHQGYPGHFLRCHLGLRVPAGDCALKVGPVVRKWQEGNVLVFDDRVIHEAWNLAGEERVVLLIDFVPGTDRDSS